ncbi:MAG: hypothetical protein ACLQDY_13955, partial [Streptosporangiaceae bacterium]
MSIQDALRTRQVIAQANGYPVPVTPVVVCGVTPASAASARAHPAAPGQPQAPSGTSASARPGSLITPPCQGDPRGAPGYPGPI